jgi:hypothetical protein
MTALAGTTTGPLMSQLQVFKFPNAGMPFVAVDMLVGIIEESVSTAVAGGPLPAFCCVDAEGYLRRVERQSGDGHKFLSVAPALGDLPRPQRLDPEQPLPWRTPASPAGVHCERVRWHLSDRRRPRVLFGHGELQPSVHAGHPCITHSEVLCIRGHGCISNQGRHMPCSLLLGNGVSSMGEPRSAACSFAAPAGTRRPWCPHCNGRTTNCPAGGYARETAPGGGPSSNVQCQNGTDLSPQGRPRCTQLSGGGCRHRSHVSRFGSYLLNLHAMRLLHRSGHVLSDKPFEQLFCLSKAARKAIATVRSKQPNDAVLAVTFSQHPVLATFVTSVVTSARLWVVILQAPLHLRPYRSAA